MKERYTLVRRTQTECQAVVSSGRWYRLSGRVCLVVAAVASGVEIFFAWRGVPLPPVTLRSVLDLSSAATASGIAPLQAAAELAVDAPLWAVFIVLAGVPYALAVERFLRAAGGAAGRDVARAARTGPAGGRGRGFGATSGSGDIPGPRDKPQRIRASPDRGSAGVCAGRQRSCPPSRNSPMTSRAARNARNSSAGNLAFS